MSPLGNWTNCDFFKTGYEHSKICTAVDRVLFIDEDTSECPLKDTSERWAENMDIWSDKNDR